jgi:hypothetical protein
MPHFFPLSPLPFPPGAQGPPRGNPPLGVLGKGRVLGGTNKQDTMVVVVKHKFIDPNERANTSVTT